MSELQGMSAERTYGWLVLAFPLAGRSLIALGWRVAAGPHRRAGSARRAIGLAFLNAIGALVQLQDKPAEQRARSPRRCGTTRSRRAST